MIPGTDGLTRHLLDLLKVPHPAHIPIGHHGYPMPRRNLHHLPQPPHQRRLAAPHLPRPCMHRQTADPRLTDLLHQRQCLLLRLEQPDLAAHGHVQRVDKRAKDVAKQVRRREKGGPHASGGGEGFGTAAIQIDSGDIVLDDEGCLDGERGGGGAELEDEVGLLDGVGPPDGDEGADVVDNAGAFWAKEQRWRKSVSVETTEGGGEG